MKAFADEWTPPALAWAAEVERKKSGSSEPEGGEGEKEDIEWEIWRECWGEYICECWTSAGRVLDSAHTRPV